MRLRLSAAQLAASRAVGWRRALVLALLCGAADELGRVAGLSGGDIARAIGVDARLVARDVRELECVGLVTVARQRGRTWVVTIAPDAEVRTPRRSAPPRTRKTSAAADTQEVRGSSQLRTSENLSADTQEVRGGADTQEVRGCGPLSIERAVRTSSGPRAELRRVPPHGAAVPTRRVKTWD